MTNGKRNRSAGHGWERELTEFFRGLGFPHVVTTRSESRARDNSKVDLMNAEERKNGQFAFNVQAKNATGHLKYAKILSEMPNEDGIINVIFHKQTEKTEGGKRFLPKGKFVIMTMADFERLIKLYNKHGIPLNATTFVQPTPTASA